MTTDKLSAAKDFLDRIVCGAMQQQPGLENLAHVNGSYGFSQLPACPGKLPFSFVATIGDGAHVMGCGWLSGWRDCTRQWQVATMTAHCEPGHVNVTISGQNAGDGLVVAYMDELQGA